MKQKIFSLILGILVGASIFYGYTLFNTSHAPGPEGRMEQGMEQGEMTDEQLERMSERSGISTEEIQSRLDAGEDLRDIIWEPSGQRRNMQ